MNTIETALKATDEILSQAAGAFKPVTFAVDALTIKAPYKGLQKGLQLLTYISRPIDFAIQLAVTPILALYQTVKVDCYESFKKLKEKKDLTEGDVYCFCIKVIASPVIFVGRTILNLWTTFPLAVAATTAVPYKTILDLNSDMNERSYHRMFFMANAYPTSFGELRIHLTGDYDEHYSKTDTFKFTRSFRAFRADVFRAAVL